MKNLALKRYVRRMKPETLMWAIRGYPMPAPSQVKFKTLQRHSSPNCDWIETGTYLAETTVKLGKLNKKNQVYSIEPAKELYDFVKNKFSRIPNLNFLNGTSEVLFENVLLRVNTTINIWLDGHYSGDVTFKGNIDSPIIYELDCLEKQSGRFKTINLFVDDFRIFGAAEGYPVKKFLVDWAEKNDYSWTVENDIFIARKSDLEAF